MHTHQTAKTLTLPAIFCLSLGYVRSLAHSLTYPIMCLTNYTTTNTHVTWIYILLTTILHHPLPPPHRTCMYASYDPTPLYRTYSYPSDPFPVSSWNVLIKYPFNNCEDHFVASARTILAYVLNEWPLGIRQDRYWSCCPAVKRALPRKASNSIPHANRTRPALAKW